MAARQEGFQVADFRNWTASWSGK